MAQIITDTNFDEIVLQNQGVVLVDFWAQWCGPCRNLMPVIEELSTEYEGKAVVGKLDVDSSSQVPMKYGIRNIPTVLLFKNGELADRIVGYVPKATFVAKLDALL